MNSDDFLMNLYSLQRYEESERDTNDIRFTKEALAVAIEERLSEKQRKYFLAYYTEGLTMTEIAEKYNVSKGVVSRLIGKARRRIWEVMRYTNRKFLHTEMPKQNATDGRHLRRKKEESNGTEV